VTTITAVLKRNEPLNVLTIEVNDLLTKLGLSHVADGIIGTLIFRGLSGGQKKRVEISSELIASPSILLMDEPTSGLDSSVAFEVLNAVKTIVKSSQGKLSVIISIHQPNSRILELFDNLLLLDNGAAVFQGSLPEAMQYFEKIGFPCPPNITPTDYFLQISDSNFKYTKNFDFEETYYASGEYVALMSYLDGADSADMVIKSYPTKHVSAFQQFYTLVYREYSLAYRDPTLYYFQLVLMLQFGFLTGAVFFQMPQGIDPDFNIFSGAILWLVLMNGWVHIFKVKLLYVHIIISTLHSNRKQNKSGYN
jgi:ABC-type multidrug transport system ATPase subunit